MNVRSYLKTYLCEMETNGLAEKAESIRRTALTFTESNLKTFTFSKHETSLLFGNVQAGKTAQMLGIICAAADASFPIFIVLTTDNVALHRQTYERVAKDLNNCGFCICDENEKQKFIDNALSKPAIIIIKKNSHVLLQWYNTLASSSLITGNALFIIDDEADSASLNTLVNQGRISSINRRLKSIISLSISSIYLQVTGTPQALILQSSFSQFKPASAFYFEPGKSYLGGDFFFADDKKDCIQIIDNIDNNACKDSLFQALVCHLVSSAILLLAHQKVCNFIIHPGVKKESHFNLKQAVIERLNLVRGYIDKSQFSEILFREYEKLIPQTIPRFTFDSVYEKAKEMVCNREIKILVMNGDTNVSYSEYSEGSNIIIGGNILGRGVTFPKLQTIYYTRTSKLPLADTMWQHSRMFGYDRDPGLMRVFITQRLYKIFSDINSANNSIISQIEKGIENIQVIVPQNVFPTRKNVIDRKKVNIIAGGVNYYPNDPKNSTAEKLDKLLSSFDSSGFYQVGAKLILEILKHIIPSDDFRQIAFENAVKARIARNPTEQCILIVRRNREVTQGTGTLLSQNDRSLGDEFKDKIVLTMYRISGKYGWKQDEIWVPNIKLPEFFNYYDVQ